MYFELQKSYNFFLWYLAKLKLIFCYTLKTIGALIVKFVSIFTRPKKYKTLNNNNLFICLFNSHGHKVQ